MLQRNGMQTAESRVVVVGAGGHGSEVHSYIQDLVVHGWRGEFLGFVDDLHPRGRHRTLDIIASLAEFAAWPSAALDGVRYLTAVGDNAARRGLVRRIEEALGGRVRPWTLIHPLASVGTSEIGEGTLLAPGAMVTSRTRIGRHTILNVKASVSHDCQVGDFVNLNPGATVCGNCRIGDGAFIGAGATVIDKTCIGEGAIVGAGAAVICDIPAHVTAVGVPAKVVKTH
ncbi:MAG TPA: NeuD/PglB/VioB family sugar acetyltransferase [Bryobacteraceae bacterium]|nr:NeuD/PglB/VioB family sugar acetyltransferase [Bryobacteraceae bacterium]